MVNKLLGVIMFLKIFYFAMVVLNILSIWEIINSEEKGFLNWVLKICNILLLSIFFNLWVRAWFF